MMELRIHISYNIDVCYIFPRTVFSINLRVHSNRFDGKKYSKLGFSF